jgi:lipid II:glycine glycyltransferase (peptidoglycan interpeptide bridge formation enzyme)
MHDFGTAYYHFAGNRDAHPELRANNLTMYETALWAQKAGYVRYHLGGGVTSRADDSLLRFKAGFSDRRAPLYTYFCVRSPRVYELLCERKRAHERATTGKESTSDFLPVYRR